MRRAPSAAKACLAVAVGRAIRRARQAPKMSQQALADALGVEQTTVSKWERGEVLAELPQIRAVEEALSLDPGAVLILAGLVKLDGGQTERYLLSDPRLRDAERVALLTLYRLSIAPRPPLATRHPGGQGPSPPPESGRRRSRRG